jgi:hypothetical protein
VALCPKCKHELPEDSGECCICGHELPDAATDEWIVLGTLENKVFADMAREALVSSNIPAMLRCKNGFFGNIGLPLRPFYRGDEAPFEILVPAALHEEACEVLDMTVGDKWRRKEN